MTLLPDSLPDGVRGRLLAFGLLLCLMCAVWSAVAAPLMDWYQERSQRSADRGALLLHMAQLAATLPALRQAARTSDPAHPVRVLLGGDGDAIAGATLQQMVQDMASAAGATLTSAEALPGEQLGNVRRIGLKVGLGTSWPVLIALLQSLESSQQRLLVDDLQVHATARTGAASAAAPIQASFVILGFRAGAAGPPRPELRAQAASQG